MLILNIHYLKKTYKAFRCLFQTMAGSWRVMSEVFQLLKYFYIYLHITPINLPELILYVKHRPLTNGGLAAYHYTIALQQNLLLEKPSPLHQGADQVLLQHEQTSTKEAHHM